MAQEVDLPVIAPSMPLTDALAFLKDSGISAAVFEREGSLWLLTAGRAVACRSRGLTIVGDVSTDDLEPTEWEPSSNVVHYHPDAATETPWRPSESHVVTSLKDGNVRLLVYDAALAARYVSGPKDYYCDGIRQHEFPPPNVAVGEACPYGDGATIVASW